VTLAEGKSETLHATVTPLGATAKLTWSSDNESIVTVDANGKLTAVSPGEATVTVSTEDGALSATCKVTVTEKDTTASPGDDTNPSDAFAGKENGMPVWAIILIVVAVLAVIAGGMFFYIKKKK